MRRCCMGSCSRPISYGVFRSHVNALYPATGAMHDKLEPYSYLHNSIVYLVEDEDDLFSTNYLGSSSDKGRLQVLLLGGRPDFRDLYMPSDTVVTSLNYQTYIAVPSVASALDYLDANGIIWIHGVGKITADNRAELNTFLSGIGSTTTLAAPIDYSYLYWPTIPSCGYEALNPETWLTKNSLTQDTVIDVFEEYALQYRMLYGVFPTSASSGTVLPYGGIVSYPTSISQAGTTNTIKTSKLFGPVEINARTRIIAEPQNVVCKHRMKSLAINPGLVPLEGDTYAIRLKVTGNVVNGIPSGWTIWEAYRTDVSYEVIVLNPTLGYTYVAGVAETLPNGGKLLITTSSCVGPRYYGVYPSSKLLHDYFNRDCTSFGLPLKSISYFEGISSSIVPSGYAYGI